MLLKIERYLNNIVPNNCMVFMRTKTIKGKKYCYLVRGIWQHGQCRQKVVRYLGKYGDIYKESKKTEKKGSER